MAKSHRKDSWKCLYPFGFYIINNFALNIYKLPSRKVVTQNQFAVKLICKRAFNRLESVHVKWLPDKDQFLLVHLTRSLTGKRTGVIANFFGV